MKIRSGILRILAVGVFIAGLGYSVLALAVKPVYAATCDCSDEYGDATEFCAGLDLATVDNAWFRCPTTPGNYQFKCNGDPTLFTFPCDTEP